MANDIDPCRDSRQLENENFATNSNGKTVRRVEDEIAIGVLQQILAQLGGSVDMGTPFFSENQTVTTPGVVQILVTETVGAGLTLTLKKIRVSCRRPVSYQIFIDSDIVGSGRCGPGNLNDDFTFDVDRTATEGQVVKVEATALAGPVTDIECYLQALEA